jgi:hypothetical protein
MTRIADRVDHPRSPIGANSLTARLTPSDAGRVSSVHDMPAAASLLFLCHAAGGI